MKRTTIFIPEELKRDLQAYASRKEVSVAAVVREAVAAYIAEPEAAPLPSFAGAFASGHGDTAERHDELLFRTLTPHGKAPRRSRPAARAPKSTAGTRRRSR